MLYFPFLCLWTRVLFSFNLEWLILSLILWHKNAVYYLRVGIVIIERSIAYDVGPFTDLLSDEEQFLLQNVLITSFGAWKLGGFGFAIMTDQAKSDSSNVQAFHYAVSKISVGLSIKLCWLHYS